MQDFRDILLNTLVKIIDVEDGNPSDLSDKTFIICALEKDGKYYYDVTVKNGYTYAATVSELRIINISNPATPHEAGAFDFLLIKQGAGKEITVSRKYAYVAAYDAGLQIINISDTAAPYAMKSIRLGGMTLSGICSLI